MSPRLSSRNEYQRCLKIVNIFKYGKVFRAYKGSGSIHLSTNDSFQCSFDAVQFADGSIRAECYFPGNNDSELNVLNWDLMSSIEVQSINGITEDNQEIVLSGQILCTNVHHRATENSRSITISIVATEMLVKPPGAELPLYTLKFGITNFEFEGNINREQKTEASHIVDRGILAVNMPFGEIRIERLPNYEEAVANLKAMQSIEPTCEISLGLFGHDTQWAKDVADNLCTILSLAKGTKIVWIYLDGYDANGAKSLALHKNAVTRPYSGASMSVIGSIYPSDIKELLENGYERLAQLKSEYKIGHVIDEYLESKRPHSYLESKGLAAIQAMELLAGKYAEKHNAKFKSLNRRTLRWVLKQVFQDVGLTVPSPNLDALIETRNALVHEGSFNTNDRVREYYRVISIMDRLLLKMLGYGGYILDCEQKWSRVKLS